MKFGRKPTRHTPQTLKSALIMARHLRPLGVAPPVSNDYVAAVDKVTGGDWGMDGNDQYGDCVEADCAHGLMLRTANVGPSIIVPTAQDTLDLYSAVTGFNPNDPNTDQGTDETQMLQFMVSTGFMGHKTDAFGTVDPQTLDHVKWCVQLFGTCRLGWNVPQYAMDQFNAGQPWDLDPSGDQTIVGGHDVPIVKYDGTWLYVVTWGKLQQMSPAFMAAFTEEAHSELDFDWIAQNGAAPSGFNLDQLANDLTAAGPPVPQPTPPPTPTPSGLSSTKAKSDLSAVVDSWGLPP